MKKVIFFVCVVISHYALADRVWQYEYNDLGKIIHSDGPRTDVLDTYTYEYDVDDNLIKEINPAGHETLYGDYNTQQLPNSITQPNGQEWLLEYDWNGNLIAREFTSSGGVVRYEFLYDADSNLLRSTLPDGQQLLFKYDVAGRLIETSNTLLDKVVYTRDKMGDVLKVEITNSSDKLFYQFEQSFDFAGRKYAEMDGEGNETTFVNNSRNQTEEITDPLYQDTFQTFDELDRLREIVDPALGVTTIDYDTAGNLASVTDPNQNTTFYEYNAYGEVVTQTSPDTGITTYTYDDAGNLLTRTNAAGQVTEYSYDALNRLTSVNYLFATSENVTYTYDSTANGNYGVGRLTQIIDESGITAYQYGDLGNLSSKTTTLDGQAYTTTYQYDLGNNPTEITYPSGLIVSYSYDSQGRVQGVTTEEPNGVPEVLLSDITYLPFGPTDGMTYGNGLSNVVAYDQDYRPVTLSTGTVVDLSYSYDANGNIVQIDHLNQPVNDQAFDYDELNRILNSTGDYGEIDYTYDPVGNRLSRDQVQGSDTKSEVYDYILGSNQLDDIDVTDNGTASQRSFTYDNNGNPIDITHTDASVYDLNSTYNAANRLSQVVTATSTVDYIYNALGQRTQKIVNENGTITTTFYLYNEAGQLMSEVNNNDQVTRDYIYLSGQPVATLVTSTEVVATDEFYIINKEVGLKLRPLDDSNGSTIIATDGSDNSDWTRYRQVSSSGGYFYLQNIQTGQYFRPVSDVDGSQLEQRPTSYNGTRTQWSLAMADSEYHFLVNRWTGKHIRPDTSMLDGPVVQRPNTWTGNWTRWSLEPTPVVNETTSALYYIHNDHLGTPRALTDQNQNVVWAATYTPFGEANITTETVSNNLRFPGQYHDAETGLHYNYFRYYDPSLGRYLKSDPIGILRDYSDPQIQVIAQFDLIELNKKITSLNHTYAYVEQNPIIWMDPTGLACFDSACVARARALAQSAENIAHGNKIRKVKVLCEKWGGKPKEWKKRKGWSYDGKEYHWYERNGQKYGMKRAGQPDPF